MLYGRLPKMRSLLLGFTSCVKSKRIASPSYSQLICKFWVLSQSFSKISIKLDDCKLVDFSTNRFSDSPKPGPISTKFCPGFGLITDTIPSMIYGSFKSFDQSAFLLCVLNGHRFSYFSQVNLFYSRLALLLESVPL